MIDSSTNVIKLLLIRLLGRMVPIMVRSLIRENGITLHLGLLALAFSSSSNF